MKPSAHFKEVHNDSWITVDITSLHQHILYYCMIALICHSKSEQYKLRDSRSRSGLGRYASKVA